MSFFRFFFPAFKKPAPSAPPGIRIYAIGDIHGSLAPLKKLHEIIKEHDAKLVDVKKRLLVYLGDYIDRGLESRQVIDYLINTPQLGFSSIFLKGNHEYALMRFLENPEEARDWLVWGGNTTIQSYGIAVKDEELEPQELLGVALRLKDKIPPEHMKFYNKLGLWHSEGDYLFVHAGLRPGVEMDAQSEDDLLMIREEFFNSNKRLDKTVVFGHTIFAQPFLGPDRIGIDTGSYASGKLTAAVIENTEINFLSSQ